MSSAKPNKDQQGVDCGEVQDLPKAQGYMVVPLCRMVPMSAMRPTFKINILKMEQAFHMGYKEGDKVYYLSPTN